MPLSTYLSPPSGHKYNPELPLAQQLEQLAYDHRWEFPKNRLKLGELALRIISANDHVALMCDFATLPCYVIVVHLSAVILHQLVVLDLQGVSLSLTFV